ASAILLGVITAAGGGLMRDVVANEIPAVFNGSDLYVIPAFTGASLTALAVYGDWCGPVAAAALAGFAFALRMTSWRLQWRGPAPVRGWSVRGFDARRRRERSVFGRPRRGGDDDEGGPGGDDEAASGHPDTDALT